jgi:hypothetical protein
LIGCDDAKQLLPGALEGEHCWCHQRGPLPQSVDGAGLVSTHHYIDTFALQQRDEGRSVHTSQYRPWRLVCYVAFANKRKAIAFEAYLKSGSGHEFRNRHLL